MQDPLISKQKANKVLGQISEKTKAHFFPWWEAQDLNLTRSVDRKEQNLQRQLSEELQDLYQVFQKAYDHHSDQPIRNFHMAASYLHFLSRAEQKTRQLAQSDYPDLFNNIVTLAARLKAKAQKVLPNAKVREAECAIVCHTWIPHLRRLLAWQMMVRLLPHGRYFYWWNNRTIRFWLITASVLFFPLIPAVALLWYLDPMRQYHAKIEAISALCQEKIDRSLSRSAFYQRIQREQATLRQMGCEPPQTVDELKSYLEIVESWLENYFIENGMLD